MNRPFILLPFAAAAALAAVILARSLSTNPTPIGAPRLANGDTGGGAKPEDSAMVRVHVFNSKGELLGPISTPKVVKTDEQWRKQLTPDQYRITRNKGTEPPFCGTLLDNKLKGVYACVCCGLPLFSSDSKFNSGTGWPSFFQPIAAGNVAEKVDNALGIERTEILCARCDAHLGHVFDDGPAPTGMRFCLNGESLTFTVSTELKKLADPAADKPAASPATAPSKSPATAPAKTAVAVFAGGCFWCTEAVFAELSGVSDVVSGYTGGSAATANYDAVSNGGTGHAEAIQITYDPARISYKKLLEVFFATHDATQLNAQGADHGTQYRSAVFYSDETQRKAAETYIEELTEKKAFIRPIVTKLEPLKAFHVAEDYHQDYAKRNPLNPYIRFQALPKLEKVHKLFPQEIKPAEDKK